MQLKIDRGGMGDGKDRAGVGVLYLIDLIAFLFQFT